MGAVLLYVAVGLVHALLVQGLAAFVRRRGWPEWARPDALGWALNLVAWPLVVCLSLIWGLRALCYNGSNER